MDWITSNIEQYSIIKYGILEFNSTILPPNIIRNIFHSILQRKYTASESMILIKESLAS